MRGNKQGQAQCGNEIFGINHDSGWEKRIKFSLSFRVRIFINLRVKVIFKVRSLTRSNPGSYIKLSFWEKSGLGLGLGSGLGLGLVGTTFEQTEGKLQMLISLSFLIRSS